MQPGVTAEDPRPIFHILPRGAKFSPAGATSIDLYVSEVAKYSRFPVEIIAEVGEPPLPAAKLHPLPVYRFAAVAQRARFVAALVGHRNPRLLIVQQHLPSAARIRALTRPPMLLQRHNFLAPPSRSWFASLRRARHVRQLRALSAITFVSQAALDDFERDWPDVETRRWVAPNGVDCAAWRPAAERELFALVVGRAHPDKGLVEAAQALAATLPERPGWRAVFVIAGAPQGGEYLSKIKAALAPLGPRARVLTDIPFADVKALNERAALALAPAKWREPFGRTCLEALAGGAAVITSGNGGLREIAGGAAIYTPEVTAQTLAEAVRNMIDDRALRERMGREGRARAERLFDLPNVAARLDGICETILARSR